MNEMNSFSWTISAPNTRQYHSRNSRGLLVCRTMCESLIGEAIVVSIVGLAAPYIVISRRFGEAEHEIWAIRRSAGTRRPGRRQLRLSRLHQLCRRGRAARFLQRLSRRTSFHRLRPDLGVDEFAELSRSAHRAYPP